jgi:predicted CoA-binding protein
MQTVAVLGASENPDRISNLACKLLREYRHHVYAVSLHGRSIHGAMGRSSVAEISEPIDTVTMYISAERQAAVIDAVIVAKPGRVIFNPGAECEESEGRLREAGIETLRACTMVLLKTGQFER